MNTRLRLVTTGIAALLLTACEGSELSRGATTGNQNADPAEALSRTPARGFERISGPRPLLFPADYGPHPSTQTEWWYLTGNLETDEGRKFGYQFTIFRLGVVPPGAVADGSKWAVGDLYMAHVAISDLSGEHFEARQRLTRPALGMAGAQASPFRVWLEGWSLEAQAGQEFFPLTLDAAFDDGEGQGALDLILDEGKQLVLQGDRGYSRKGADVEDASLYYSFTKIPTRGVISVNGERFDVAGYSWLDREWSTSVLSRSQRGWDWFALQLEDGRELMLFELRSDDPSSAVVDGTLIERDGSTRRLERSDVNLTVVDRWPSDEDGTLYPSAWQLELPNHGINLRIESALGNQEHTEVFRYWEGSVNLTSPDGGRVGRGYAELTGYAVEGR